VIVAVLLQMAFATACGLVVYRFVERPLLGAAHVRVPRPAMP
jgi:hypothetical protein